MKIIDKALYLKAIWFIISGVFGICIGIKFYVEQPKSLDDLYVMKGVITDVFNRDLFSEKSRTTQNCMIIYINDTLSAYALYDSDIEALSSANIKKGDSCQIWAEMGIRIDVKSRELQRYRIEALEIGNEQIIEFKNQSYLSLIIFMYALIVFIPALFFVLKHPEILFGQKNDDAKED